MPSRASRAAVAVLCLVGAARASADDTSVATTPAPAPLLKPALTYDGTLLGNAHGGLQRGGTYFGTLHLKLTAQGESIGWPGIAAYADVLNLHGGNPGRLVGDAQGVSNIAGPHGTQFEELWVQYDVESISASVLAGLYDLNSEFYRLQSAGLFVNSAFGIGPEFAQSGVEGPSIFPRTSVGLRAAIKPTPNTVLRAALLDGVPVVRPDGSRASFRSGDGLLGIVEFAMLSRPRVNRDGQPRARNAIGRFSSLSPYQDKLAIGAWHYSTRQADLVDTDAQGRPVERRGSSGAYVIGEHLLIGDEGSNGHHLAAFVQAGAGDPRTDRFGSYLGAGIAGSGWTLLHDTDQWGLSVAHARNGSHDAKARAERTGQPPNRAETTVEATWLTQLSPMLSLQPDVQLVTHPNTDPSIGRAVVLQMRFEVAF